jgi:triphosphoribosyl-dephospho-CoA synthase
VAREHRSPRVYVRERVVTIQTTHTGSIAHRPPCTTDARVRCFAIRVTAAENIGALAAECLRLEVNTHPKPGLVSHIDAGAHRDMDAQLLYLSADTLAPFFAQLVAAGAVGAGLDRLREIGVAAERAMLAATDGVNTHRGAIFGLGLMAAAAGFRDSNGISGPLGRIVAALWGRSLASMPAVPESHGAGAARRYGAGGARKEAALGFPSVYGVAIPALAVGRKLAGGDAEPARVHACLALIAAVGDTNLLHRGGLEGLAFAQRLAQAFLAAGGVGQPGWRRKALRIHEMFVARHLSPGGCADLLAMALFAQALGSGPAT